jgi:CheY-like chemotaxis protein
MPQLSGQEVLAALHSLASRPKVVLLTGSISALETFEGVDAVIDKPVLLEDLFHTVREVLDK